MRKCALAATVAATLVLGATAQGKEHTVRHQAVIDHPVGMIAADYHGTPRVTVRQVGTAGVGGRQDTLRCHWTVSLDVERQALLGSGQHALRTFARSDVAKGSTAGWCPERDEAARRIAAKHSNALHAALLALVEQDRALLLAEADRVRSSPREG